MQLLERESQLQQLESALRAAKAGQGCTALVYGEAGIGKTSLVDYFLAGKEPDWRVLSGACDLLFTPRPLGPLGDIALQTKGRLLRLLEQRAEREQLFSACLGELGSRPTILVIEDVHWADEATLDLLKYLARRIRDVSCLIVLTYREDEVGSDSQLRLLLGDIASSQAVQRVAIPALSVEAVRQLTTSRPLDPASLHRLTNGNPFFLTEVLATGDIQRIPQTVRDAMQARVARLSPAAREALEAAAIGGLRVEAWLLAEMMDKEPAAVEECVARGLLRMEGEAYAFRHELSRQTILDSISLHRKRDLHRKALTGLSASPMTCNDLARLATHAEGSGEAAAVLEYGPAAARQAAAVGAHRQGAALYELALRFAAALPALEHAQLLEAYADERWFLPHREELIPMRREIIQRQHALGNQRREGVNLALLASELHGAGRADEADKAINAAVGMLETLPPSAELAVAYRAQCFLLEERMEYKESVAAGLKSITLAEKFADIDTLARSCQFAGYELLLMGDGRGRDLLHRSRDLARVHSLDYAMGLVLSNWTTTLVGICEFEEADQLVQEGIAYTTEHDDDNHLSGMLVNRAEIWLYRGRWTEAANLLEQTRQDGRFQRERKESIRLLGRLGVRRGDAGAEQTLREVLSSYIEAGSFEGLAGVRAGLAEAAWLSGDSTRCAKEASADYDRLVDQHVVWSAGELAYWRWRAGDDFTPPDWIAKPYALQIAGKWREAAQEWEKRGCPYEQGMALMDGNTEAQLRALRIFEDLGARPIIDRLEQRLRAKGVRNVPRGPRTTTRANRFEITRREMEVLQCVVNGFSNQSIAKQLSLSTRTVEHHIASMLQKTGVRTRNELAALALKERLLATI